MKFCVKCGVQVTDETTVCPNCQTTLNYSNFNPQSVQQNLYHNNNSTQYSAPNVTALTLSHPTNKKLNSIASLFEVFFILCIISAVIALIVTFCGEIVGLYALVGSIIGTISCYANYVLFSAVRDIHRRVVCCY